MLFHLVMLVPDFTDQFLQNILHRHNAERSAKIVYNDGDVRFLALERLQDIPNLRVLIDKQRRGHDFRNGALRHLAVAIEILLT